MDVQFVSGEPSGYARGFNVVCLGWCRDQVYTVLVVPVRGGSAVSSWGPVEMSSGGAVGRALALGLVGMPTGKMAGAVSAAGTVCTGTGFCSLSGVIYLLARVI